MAYPYEIQVDDSIPAAERDAQARLINASYVTATSAAPRPFDTANTQAETVSLELFEGNLIIPGDGSTAAFIPNANAPDLAEGATLVIGQITYTVQYGTNQPQTLAPVNVVLRGAANPLTITTAPQPPAVTFGTTTVADVLAGVSAGAYSGGVAPYTATLTVMRGATELGPTDVVQAGDLLRGFVSDSTTVPGVSGPILTRDLDDVTLTSAVTNVAPTLSATINDTAENVAIGTVIGTFTATGTPAPTVTLTGALAAVAQINGTNIETTAALDFETTTSYAWTLTAANGTLPDATQSGTMNVTDVADTQPTAAGSLADLVLTENTAMAALNVAADFTGADTYALAPTSAALPAGLTLSAAGVLSGTPTASQALSAIVVRGTNTASGLFADSAFNLTVTASTTTIGQVTVNSALATGQDQYGVNYMVLPSGTTEMEDPGPGVVVQLNPQRVSSGANYPNQQATNDQGFVPNPDTGENQYGTYEAGDAVSAWPLTISPGDIVVIATPVATPTEAAERDGLIQSYEVCHFLPAAPADPANYFTPAAVGWVGRGTPSGYTVDVAAYAATWPTLSTDDVTPISNADRTNALDMLAQPYPAYAMNTLPNGAGGGYEVMMPFGIGDSGGGESNYGGSIRYRKDTLWAIFLTSTDANERTTIMRYFIRNGIDLIDPVIGSGARIAVNGGHHQFEPDDAMVALDATGRSADIANLPTTLESNPFGQAFDVDQSVLDRLVPHNSSSEPYPYRRRNVLSVSGSTVVVETNQAAGDPSQWSGRNMLLTRESDGATALVTSQSIPDGGGSATNITSNNWPVHLVIDAQPTTPFAANDVVYLQAVSPPQIGDADWKINVAWDTYNPAASAVYRNVNDWTMLALVSKLMFDVPATQRFINLVRRTNFVNFPVGDDMPDHFDNPYAESLWRQEYAQRFPMSAASATEHRILRILDADFDNGGTITGVQFSSGGTPIGHITSANAIVLYDAAYQATADGDAFDISRTDAGSFPLEVVEGALDISAPPVGLPTTITINNQALKVYDSDPLGSQVATVMASGTHDGADGVALQIRLINSDTNAEIQGWTDFNAGTGGQWTAMMAVSRGRTRLRYEVRARDATAVNRAQTDFWFSGIRTKWSGQSLIERPLLSTDSNGLTLVPPAEALFVTLNTSNGGVSETEVTAASTLGQRRAACVAGAYADCPVAIDDGTQSGTSRRGYSDNADTDRDASTSGADVTQFVKDGGSAHFLILEHWITNDATTGDTTDEFKRTWSPFYAKKQFNGIAAAADATGYQDYVDGTTISVQTTGYVADNSMFDTRTPYDPLTTNLPDASRTKLAFFYGAAHRVSTDVADGASATGDRDKGEIRDTLRLISSDPDWAEFLIGGTAGYNRDFAFGSHLAQPGGTHVASGVNGESLVAVYLMRAVLRAAGMITDLEPQLNTTPTGGEGYIEFDIDNIPAGYTLSTPQAAFDAGYFAGSFEGDNWPTATAVVGDKAEFKNVMGFGMNFGSGNTWQDFTTSIEAGNRIRLSSTTLADGQTGNFGYHAGETISLFADIAAFHPELYMPVLLPPVHVSGTGLGIPIVKRPNDAALFTATGVTQAPAGPSGGIVFPADAWIRDPVNVPAGTTRITWRDVSWNFGGNAPANATRLITQESTGNTLQVLNQSGTLRLRVTVEDNSSGKLLNAVTVESSSGVDFVWDASQELSIDLFDTNWAAGTVDLTINGAAMVQIPFTAGSTAQSSREISLGATTTGNAQVPAGTILRSARVDFNGVEHIDFSDEFDAAGNVLTQGTGELRADWINGPRHKMGTDAFTDAP